VAANFRNRVSFQPMRSLCHGVKGSPWRGGGRGRAEGTVFFFFQVVFKVTYFKNKIFMQPMRRFCHEMKGFVFSLYTHIYIHHIIFTL
jgi:hypothetical protein